MFFLLAVLWFTLVVFYLSSFHSLILLLVVELGLLLFITFGAIFTFSFFSLLMVVLIGVCLGAYGVSLVACLIRSKGDSYFLAFYF